MNDRHTESARQVAHALNRHRALMRWLDLQDRMVAIKPRTPEERAAQCQALQLMEQARP